VPLKTAFWHGACRYFFTKNFVFPIENDIKLGVFFFIQQLMLKCIRILDRSIYMVFKGEKSWIKLLF